MTKEEMAKSYSDDFDNEIYKEIAYDAFLCGFTAKCESSLPSNLDEAEFEYAQSLDEIPANQEEEKMIYDAFKAGAEWRDAQIPKLSNNLDEVAENRVTKNGRFKITSFEKMRIEDIMFGAEWMAKQGETVEGYITDEIAYNGIAVILNNEEQFKPGDKVIVQIRKKEE